MLRHVAFKKLTDISEGAYCLRHQGDLSLVMEAVSTSETSVSVYETSAAS
jgi:hypothetical protein